MVHTNRHLYLGSACLVIPCSADDTNTKFHLPDQVPPYLFGRKEIAQMVEQVNQELRKSDLLTQKLKNLRLKGTICRIFFVVGLLVLLTCLTCIPLKIYDVIDDGVHDRSPGNHCLEPCSWDSFPRTYYTGFHDKGFHSR